MPTPQAPIGSGFGAATTAADVIAGIDLGGKAAIVTGGYSGLGRETVRALKAAGARVIVPARDVGRSAAALAGLDAEIEPMDLLDPASIDAFTAKFLSSAQPLHILINSAGIMACPLSRDARGYEAQFATNHLGHFQLALRLWPALVRAEGARVVSVSSWGHHFSPVIFDDPNSERREYDPWSAYGQSKTANMRDMRIDTAIGMISAELAQWFIIITTASVLFAHGVTNINTAADAARALEPLVKSFPNSGQIARDIFAVGIIGLGLLGIPVLAGSAAYALAEAMNWREGLSKRLGEAKGFYGVIIVSTLVGLAMNFIGIDPIKALVFTAVFNGIAAVPLLFLIAWINGSEAILGENRGGIVSSTFVWLTFGVMGLASAALLYTTLAPQ